MDQVCTEELMSIISAQRNFSKNIVECFHVKFPLNRGNKFDMKKGVVCLYMAVRAILL